MPWRYSDDPPASPFCSEYARRKVGKSVTGRLAETTRRVDRLEAVTVFDARQPRGLYLQDGSGNVPINFDTDGRILITSSDGSVGLSRPWTRKSALDLVVTAVARCFIACTAWVNPGLGGTEMTRWAGFLQQCKDNGDGTYTCVAVPYITCTTPGNCEP